MLCGRVPDPIGLFSLFLESIFDVPFNFLQLPMRGDRKVPVVLSRPKVLKIAPKRCVNHFLVLILVCSSRRGRLPASECYVKLPEFIQTIRGKAAAASWHYGGKKTRTVLIKQKTVLSLCLTRSEC